MLANIIKKEVQDFINVHLNDDLRDLALKKNPFPDIEYKVVLNQIATKVKAYNKLPTWFKANNIVYPEKISLEQTSSEKTAQYKASIISGASLVDLTGGFGVDCYYFSKKIASITHCELNPDLSKIVQHNFMQLGVNNCAYYSGDGFDFLKKSPQKWDWIYIDPSRRDASKNKVFLLAECTPNVPELLDFYLEKSNTILLKAAPFLDISSAIKELKLVRTVHIVSVFNEVKELLFEICKEKSNQIAVKTIDFGHTINQFDSFLEEETPNLHYGFPKRYLYEPNSAIMKSGLFEVISSRFNLIKLHQNTHLYTSDFLIDFPGRRFEIKDYFLFNKENMKKKMSQIASNVTIRNFPESVEGIRKKWQISDGGVLYSFFSTDFNNKKIVLLCTKI